MTCQEYQQWLVPYLHGQLEADHREELAAHLTGCGVCANELAEYRQLEEQLRSVCKVIPPKPENTIAAVNARIDAWEAQQAQGVGVNRLVRYGLAVAAATVLVVVVSRPLLVRQIARNQPAPSLIGGDTPEQATEAPRMQWDVETPPMIHVQWIVTDRGEATTTLSEWLTQIQDARLVSTEKQPWRSSLSRNNTASAVATTADADRLIVQLPVSSYSALLAELAKHGQLSSQPPAPEAVSTDQSLTVELSLVVQAP